MKTIFQTSAGGIVFKKNYSLSWLICQHSQHKGWVFPKGLVGDQNCEESMESAALREVEEEGGIKAKIINPKPIVTSYEYIQTISVKAPAVKVKKTVYYFLMEYISGDPKNHDWEMMDAKFVNTNEIKKTLTYPSDKEAFEKIIQRL
jgi:8-oxo-dGTP pyrophosphatase MutT (NUDIX family)